MCRKIFKCCLGIEHYLKDMHLTSPQAPRINNKGDETSVTPFRSLLVCYTLNKDDHWPGGCSELHVGERMKLKNKKVLKTSAKT